jgi:hypothetical protein
MNETPNVVTTPFPGFWGSRTLGGADSATETWGAGWAWYALVAGAVLFLIAGIFLVQAKPLSAVQTTSSIPQQP